MYTNSSLANYIDKSTGNYVRRTQLITCIIIHCSGVVGNCDKLSTLFGMNTQTSCNYGIGNDGTIGLFVDESQAASATGNASVNQRSVSIMVMNSSTSGDLPISAEAQASLIKLITDICRRNFILSLKYTGIAATSTLLMPSWFQQSPSPGAYVSNLYPSIVNQVNANLSSPVLATSEAEAKKSQSVVVVSEIAPYVAIIDRTLRKVPVSNLRLAGVVGLLLDGGNLYDASHAKVAHAAPKYLPDQVKQCDEVGMPYGLYWTSRCNDTADAKFEASYLYYIVSKYPPKLGIWINFEFRSPSRKINDTLVSTYYKECVEWGLKSKCGIYVNKANLSKFNWPSFSDKMSLWIKDAPSNLDNLDELMVPEFFKVRG